MSIEPGCHFWTLLGEYGLRSTRSRRINWFCCKLWSKTIGLNKIANQQKKNFGTPYSTWAVWVFALSFAEQLSFLLLYIRLFLKASLSFISIFIVRQLKKLSEIVDSNAVSITRRPPGYYFVRVHFSNVEVNCPDTAPCHLYTWTLWASSALSYLWHINQIDMRGFS